EWAVTNGLEDTDTILNIEIEGTGGFTGTVRVPFRVRKGDFSKLNIKIDDQYYTGHAVTIDKSVIHFTGPKNVVAPADDDYEIVGYSNNINKGTATVVLRAVGNDWAGIKSVTFKIKQRSLLSLLLP
ncbi:MAG: hypothetical protein K6E16_10470, partial [Lachnospiraceae bacterium]|nr:hypothetical protein [Lachnospiraceae bacterium]